MTPKEVETYLNSFINYEYHLQKLSPASFQLDRIRELLKLLGDPQKKIKFIHIAGSKGKGSTASLTASILKEAGYRVGLYTSPHFYSLNERIRILRQGASAASLFQGSVSNKRLNDVLRKVKPFLEKMRSTKEFGDLTFFEVLTALAFVYFLQEKVDWVVLETGLGGRLDATNVVSSSVCVITPISLEHTQILGDTLTKIAVEKAAIIKEGSSRVVVSPQERKVRQVIQKRCKDFQIKPIWVGKDIQYKLKSWNLKEQIFDIIQGGQRTYPRLKIPLLGEHQLMNATTAVGIMKSLRGLGGDVPKDAVCRGLKKVYWPGRFEMIKRDPYVILDGAHNGASVKNLVDTARMFFPKKKAIVVLGISTDKNKKDIVKNLNKISSLMILTKANHPRAVRWEEAEAKRYFSPKEFLMTKTVKEAVKLAYARRKKDDIILITGSLFVVAEARKLLKR